MIAESYPVTSDCWIYSIALLKHLEFLLIDVMQVLLLWGSVARYLPSEQSSAGMPKKTAADHLWKLTMEYAKGALRT
jgi:hypothetical protein